MRHEEAATVRASLHHPRSVLQQPSDHRRTTKPDFRSVFRPRNPVNGNPAVRQRRARTISIDDRDRSGIVRVQRIVGKAMRSPDGEKRLPLRATASSKALVSSCATGIRSRATAFSCKPTGFAAGRTHQAVQPRHGSPEHQRCMTLNPMPTGKTDESFPNRQAGVGPLSRKNQRFVASVAPR